MKRRPNLPALLDAADRCNRPRTIAGGDTAAGHDGQGTRAADREGQHRFVGQHNIDKFAAEIGGDGQSICV
jgi:hypothetical protein